MISSCPFCHKQVLSVELEWHVNSHFEDDELQRDMELAQQIAVAPPSPRNMAAPENYAELFVCNYGWSQEASSSSISECSPHNWTALDREISCLVGAQVRCTFQKIEGGLMNLLRNCLELESGSSRSIISGYVDHYQSLNSEDKGWGCGWRNIQMLSSHLLHERPEARDVLYGGAGFVPDIASLQRWLEIAWKKGFDTIGSSHFQNRIYGIGKWIGTTECAALFRSFGLRARVIDFDSTKSSDCPNNGNKKGKGVANQVRGPMDKFLQRNHDHKSSSSCDELSHEERCSIRGQQVLADWVWNYFASKTSSRSNNSRHVTISDKMPLYFQHQGHSRTIVGIQRQKGLHGSQDKYVLLILDPGHRTTDLERSLRDKKGWQSLVKRGVHTLTEPQYQLCYVDPGVASLVEMGQLKTIDSTLVRF